MNLLLRTGAGLIAVLAGTTAFATAAQAAEAPTPFTFDYRASEVSPQFDPDRLDRRLKVAARHYCDTGSSSPALRKAERQCRSAVIRAAKAEIANQRSETGTLR